MGNFKFKCFTSLFTLTVVLILTPSLVIAQSGKNNQLWLQGLGISDAIAQLDSVIEREINQLSSQQALKESRLPSVQKTLIDHSGSREISRLLQVHLENTQADISEKEINYVLNHPLVVRARNFDVALEVKGAFKKYRTYKRKLLKTPPSEKRISLIRKLDKVQHTSHLAALLQTQVSFTAGRLVTKLGGPVRDDLEDQWLDVQRAQRESHLQEVSLPLNLYSYRFMKDKEIEEYIRLMETPSVQRFISNAISGIDKSLVLARSNLLK